MNKENKTFTVNQVAVAEQAIAVLRACPAIPFAIASQVNANYAAFKGALLQHNESMELLRERNLAAQQLQAGDPAAFASRLEEDKQELVRLLKVTHTLVVTPVSAAVFAGMQIDGEKEVRQADGGCLRFSYRDAYFNLLELGIITE